MTPPPPSRVSPSTPSERRQGPGNSGVAIAKRSAWKMLLVSASLLCASTSTDVPQLLMDYCQWVIDFNHLHRRN